MLYPSVIILVILSFFKKKIRLSDRFFLSIFHMFEAGRKSGFDMAHIMYCVFLAGAMNAMDAF